MADTGEQRWPAATRNHAPIMEQNFRCKRFFFIWTASHSVVTNLFLGPVTVLMES